jgi:hypothetical protein
MVFPWGDDTSCASTRRVCRGSGAAPRWCTHPLPLLLSGSPPHNLSGLLTDPSRGAREGRSSTGAAPRHQASAAARPATARRVAYVSHFPFTVVMSLPYICCSAKRGKRGLIVSHGVLRHQPPRFSAMFSAYGNNSADERVVFWGSVPLRDGLYTTFH